MPREVLCTAQSCVVVEDFVTGSGLASLMGQQKCPSCRERSPKRSCPALGAMICTVCCATKRQVEIQCPRRLRLSILGASASAGRRATPSGTGRLVHPPDRLGVDRNAVPPAAALPVGDGRSTRRVRSRGCATKTSPRPRPLRPHDARNSAQGHHLRAPGGDVPAQRLTRSWGRSSPTSALRPARSRPGSNGTRRWRCGVSNRERGRPPRRSRATSRRSTSTCWRGCSRARARHRSRANLAAGRGPNHHTLNALSL